MHTKIIARDAKQGDQGDFVELWEQLAAKNVPLWYLQLLGEPDKQGFFVKKGGIGGKLTKRWFVLCGTLLFYFSNQQTEARAKGVVPLSGCEVDPNYEVDPKEASKYSKKADKGGISLGFCWAIKTRMREFVFSCDTEEERREWTAVCQQNSEIAVQEQEIRKLLWPPEQVRKELENSVTSKGTSKPVAIDKNTRQVRSSSTDEVAELTSGSSSGAATSPRRNLSSSQDTRAQLMGSQDKRGGPGGGGAGAGNGPANAANTTPNNSSSASLPSAKSTPAPVAEPTPQAASTDNFLDDEEGGTLAGWKYDKQEEGVLKVGLWGFFFFFVFPADVCPTYPRLMMSKRTDLGLLSMMKRACLSTVNILGLVQSCGRAKVLVPKETGTGLDFVGGAFLLEHFTLSLNMYMMNRKSVSLPWMIPIFQFGRYVVWGRFIFPKSLNYSLLAFWKRPEEYQWSFPKGVSQHYSGWNRSSSPNCRCRNACLAMET